MNDMISREAAIATATSCPDSHWGPWIAERLRALPAVQPDAAGLSAGGGARLGGTWFYPFPTLEWPDENPPASWWGYDTNGVLTKVYRSYEDYCDDLRSGGIPARHGRGA